MVNEAFFVRLFFINSWSLEKKKGKNTRMCVCVFFLGGGGLSRLLAINSIYVEPKAARRCQGKRLLKAIDFVGGRVTSLSASVASPF